MNSIRFAAPPMATIVIAGLLLASCGDDANTSDPEGNPSSPAQTEQMVEMDEMDEMDHESFDFGEAADASAATRTIEISAQDSFQYDPSSVEVSAGETVLFVVTNVGKVTHEFTLGDEELQEDHEIEMSEMPSGMTMSDEPNAISIEPGETKQLAFTFNQSGSISYACHEAGHFAAGMVGDIIVTSE